MLNFQGAKTRTYHKREKQLITNYKAIDDK